MSSPLPAFPFDEEWRLGSISEVGASFAKVNITGASARAAEWLHGRRVGFGEVGEFVVIDCGEYAVVGRVEHIWLPERERLSVEPSASEPQPVHPIGKLQLSATLNIRTGVVSSGLVVRPRLGAATFAVGPELLKWIASSGRASNQLVVALGSIGATGDTTITVPLNRLYGRHCAVLGATGGGKSWTVARMVQETSTLPGSKLLLIDATGEFHTTIRTGIRHLQLGSGNSEPHGSVSVGFPYDSFTEQDLFALFKPAGQSQGPKLRHAIRSLKLVRLQPDLGPSGVLKKAQRPRNIFGASYQQHASEIEGPAATFDINHLAQQISEECIYPTDRDNSTLWGNYNESERSYCTPLISRIEDILQAPGLACVFRAGELPSLGEEIVAFLDDTDAHVLRISLRHLPFDHNAREIIVNALGRLLLTRARTGAFRALPLVVAIDEAHQFINHAIGDEASRYQLDSFELIAKEGRKYALTLCLATQRPRDIPAGVLSQVGTMIVHRLTNEHDRSVVEQASGEVDRSLMSFLPTLAPGQAIIVGVDFSLPLTVRILPPAQRPDSKGPDYDRYWVRQSGPNE